MFNRFMNWLVEGIRLRLVGPTLLEDIEQLKLGSTIDDANRLYGSCVEQEINEDFPESRCYSYVPTAFHIIDVWEWKSVVHAIVYYSAQGDPELDLATIRDTYGDQQDWTVINKGYNYRRADRQVQLWCSAMPAIGVGTEEYMQAQSQYSASEIADQEVTESTDEPGA